MPNDCAAMSRGSSRSTRSTVKPDVPLTQTSTPPIDIACPLAMLGSSIPKLVVSAGFGQTNTEMLSPPCVLHCATLPPKCRLRGPLPASSAGVVGGQRASAGQPWWVSTLPALAHPEVSPHIQLGLVTVQLIFDVVLYPDWAETEIGPSPIAAPYVDAVPEER